MSDAITADGDVSSDVSHGVGIITLNRPRARNALTTADGCWPWVSG